MAAGKKTSKKPLSESHKTRLINNGIPEDLIGAAGIFSVTAEEIFQLTGVKVHSTGIAFPYPGESDGYLRVRLDQPLGDMKYVAPCGAGCRLYVPPGAKLDAPLVVITEGEKKALVAASRGINCVAVAGIDAWREKGPLGEKQTPEAGLLGRLKKDWSCQTVVLVYDSDITQAHRRWSAFPALAEILYSLDAETVKVFSLPELPGTDKTGLDDFILACEKAGEDGAARFQDLAGSAQEWLPTGTGAEKYAVKRLKPDADPEEQVKGAAALLAAKGEFVLEQTLLNAGMKKSAVKMLMKAARKLLSEAEARQKCTWKPAPGGDGEPDGGVTIVSLFPPAAEVVPPDFPMPPRNLEGWSWDIRDGKVVRYKADQEGNVIVRPGLDTVALLTAWLSPVEEGDEEKWELAWRQNGQWVRRHFSSGVLFDTREKQTLIKAGVEINSNNADAAVDWFHSLRVLVTQGGVSLPTVRTVSRCGWHKLGDKPLFVLGHTVLAPGDSAAAAGGGVAPEIEKPDDVEWAGDISPLEKQILAGFGTRGDPEKQRSFLLDACLKYPQVAFGIGCAAGAPLIKIAQEAGLAPDFSGFTVLMRPVDAGRKRHQGKTTWSQVIASFYGNPAVGENGRIRYANRTGVSNGVLLSTCCDLTVHLDELQEMGKGVRKGSKNEIESFVRMVTQGMDRERGARGGGGRRTRTFRVVVFATAESDVTMSFDVGGGAHDRILKLPQLLPEESDENRAEAERMESFCLKNYGHAGREYITWLLGLIEAGKEDEVAAEIERAVAVIRGHYLPADDRRGSAGRLATRAAVGLAGLSLWLESVGVPKDVAGKILSRFLEAWRMACEGIPAERMDEEILAVVQGYVAANQEAIHGLRENEKAPAKWVGAKATVQGKECIVLFENGLAEEIERRTGMPYKQAREVLKMAGLIVTRKEGDKTRYTQKVNKGDLKGIGLAFPISVLFGAESCEEAGWCETEDVPF